jgi:hypothetical protein
MTHRRRRTTPRPESSLVAGKVTTYTMGLGTDNQVYETNGNWASNPPSFSGWTMQTG